MSSFRTQAARVRDTGLPASRRLLALRECVLHFAPYGFRATWHHLVVHANIPVRLDEDPDSLLRALDELEHARRLWFAETQAYRVQRRQEKASGLRQARRADGWRTSPHWLAFCPDPETHPVQPLATVVGGLLAAYRAAPVSADTCPVCQVARMSRPCPGCGVWSWDPAVYPWNPTGERPPDPPPTVTRAGLPPALSPAARKSRTTHRTITNQEQDRHTVTISNHPAGGMTAH